MVERVVVVVVCVVCKEIAIPARRLVRRKWGFLGCLVSIAFRERRSGFPFRGFAGGFEAVVVAAALLDGAGYCCSEAGGVEWPLEGRRRDVGSGAVRSGFVAAMG